MINKIDQHPLIKAYSTSALAWEQQSHEQWRLAAEEFQALKKGQGAVPELAAAYSFCEGQAARKQELYEQAATRYLQAGEQLPDWPLVPEALADVFRRLGRRADAEAHLNRALKLAGGLLHARLLYAELLCERNNYKAAEDVLKLGLKHHPEEPAFHCLLGHIALSDRRLEAAERSYRRALTLAPDYADAYTGLSSLMILQQRYADAHDQVKMALKINQRATAAIINLGILHYLLDQPLEAETQFERAVRFEPRNAQNYFRLATFYWQQNERTVAERYLRLAINCESFRSEYHSALGLLLFLTDRVDEAERHYHQALLLNPEDIFALQGLGALALLRGENSKAETLLARAETLLLTSRRYLTSKISSNLHPMLRSTSSSSNPESYEPNER